MTTEGNIAAKGMPGKYDMVIRGERFTLVHTELNRMYRQYWFELEWEGDGILPWVELVWISSNADYNEATIINLEADVREANKELVDIRDYLQSRAKNQQQVLEDEIARLQDKLAHTQAKLKQKGEPPQPLKPTT